MRRGRPALFGPDHCIGKSNVLRYCRGIPDVQADGFNNAVRIVRVTADGKLISATRMFGVSAARTQWSFKALADSSVIVARSSQDVGSSSTVLFRLSRDDTLDPAFGPGGAFTIDDMSHVSALALDNAGRLLVSGQVRDQFVVRRYVFQPAPVGTVVEFFNTLLQHYFLTADPAEANAIDAGAAGAGWSRTGLKFKSGGPTLVCRFYGNANRSADDTPYGPNSHFYTADPSECGGLVDLYNPAAKSWKYESHDFATTLPNGTAGQPACPAGLVAVYRAYNDGFARGIDSNHRIVSSQAAIQEVVSRGWINEGIVMCAPT